MKSCDCKWHSSVCDCARPGTNQVCLLDYGCPCDYFTFDGDVLSRHIDEITLKKQNELLEWLNNQESPMKKAGAIFENLWQEVVDYVKSDKFFARMNYLCRLRTAMELSNIQIESDTMKKEQVIHVCLGDDRHYYFGSVAAIFDTFTPDELGVSLPTLWNYGLAPDRPYKNNRCAIYRGNINRKKQNETRRSQVHKEQG